MTTSHPESEAWRGDLPGILGFAALEHRVAGIYLPLLGCVLGIALLARTLVAVLTADTDPATAQMFEYGEMAMLSMHHPGIVWWADGSHYVFPTAFMPPLLIFFDMFWFWVLGISKAALCAIIGCNVLFGTGICYYTVRIARTLFNSRVIALLAGLIVALHPVFVYSVATYHALNLYVLLLLVLFDLCSSRYRPSVGHAVAVGVVFGIAALARTEYLMLGLAIVAGAAFAHRRVLLLAISVLVAAAVVSPWTIRNYMVFHRLIPVVDSMGYNLAKSYNPGANGSGHWVDNNHVLARLLGPQIDAVPLTPNYEIDTIAIYAAEAHDFIHNNPVKALIILPIRKVLLFWLFDIYDPTTHKILYQIALWPTILLSLAGAVYVGRRGWWTNPDFRLIVTYFLAQTVVIAAYSVHARYRTNVEPFLFCFAAVGLLWAAQTLRHVRRRDIAPIRSPGLEANVGS
jgi:hypothetical protein